MILLRLLIESRFLVFLRGGKDCGQLATIRFLQSSVFCVRMLTIIIYERPKLLQLAYVCSEILVDENKNKSDLRNKRGCSHGRPVTMKTGGGAH